MVLSDYQRLDYMSESDYSLLANPPACRAANMSILMHSVVVMVIIYVYYLFMKKSTSVLNDFCFIFLPLLTATPDAVCTSAS